MKAKNKFLYFIIATAVLTYLIGGCKSEDHNIKYKIAIAQYIDHPGLNAAKKGFLDELANKGYKVGKNTKIDEFNAYGDNSAVITIVNRIYNGDYNLILTLATPISQTAKKKFADRKTPIIYGVITDPISAGLVNSMDKPGGYNTASSDQWPYFAQMDLIHTYFPNYTRIGVPYNPSEFNTQYAIKQTKEAADSLGLQIIEKAMYNINDATTVVSSLSDKVDIIYIPADNTAMTAAPTIIKTASKNNIPVLAGDPGTFSAGALLGLGVSYYDLGKQTAELAIKILNGTEAGTLPVAIVKNPELMLNEKVAKELKIVFPADLVAKADTVIQ